MELPVEATVSQISSVKMATPSELSLEEIRKYLLENGGSVRNHDLVKYFKKFLTDPETRGRLNINVTGVIMCKLCVCDLCPAIQCEQT